MVTSLPHAYRAAVTPKVPFKPSDILLVLMALLTSIVIGQLAVGTWLPANVTGTHSVTDGNRTYEVFFDANGSYQTTDHNGTYAFHGQRPALNRQALVLRPNSGDTRTVSFPGMLRDRLASMGTVIVFMQLAGIGLAIWLVKHHRIRWREAFGGLGDPANSIAVPLLVSFLVLPAVLALHFVSKFLLDSVGITESAQQAVQMVSQASHPAELALQGISVIVLAPIAEELIFRGIIYNTTKQITSRTAAVLLSAMLFAAVHGQWALVLPLMGLSVALVWVYERAGTILAPILLHASFNAVNFALIRFADFAKHAGN